MHGYSPSTHHLTTVHDSKMSQSRWRRCTGANRPQCHRNSPEIRRPFDASTQRHQFAINEQKKKKAYSGSVIFCKLEKKSDLIMVEAERMLPERLTTTCVTSSGSATPPLASARSKGFNEFIPSSKSSFSKVLITSHPGYQSVNYAITVSEFTHQACFSRKFLSFRTTALYPALSIADMIGIR